jgi:outer membrane biosynthesis protein TonB
MELELIEDVDSNTTRDEAVMAPTLRAVTLDAALITPRVPLLDSDEMQADLDEAEAAARSNLIGRYLGQIDARIERAWRRPRTPVAEGLFSCRVRIEQDTRGDVQEITLEHCNGDTRWQVSLVQAIQLASPLPAPPDPTVFRRTIRMNFRSEPYSAQAAQDAFEPVHQ